MTRRQLVDGIVAAARHAHQPEPAPEPVPEEAAALAAFQRAGCGDPRAPAEP